MNKRIKELSKEAGLVADETYAKAPDAIWLKEYNKKFAELLVKECISLRNELSQFDVSDAFGDGYENGLKDLAETIEEQFGV